MAAGYMSRRQVCAQRSMPLRYLQPGTILYEMLAGRSAVHARETAAETMTSPEGGSTARFLKLPPRLRSSSRCLEKRARCGFSQRSRVRPNVCRIPAYRHAGPAATVFVI
jgi:hypothetical protein